jgi:hypothetical protein
MATNTKFLLFLTKLQDAVPDNEDDLIKSIMEEVDLSIAKFPVKWNGKKHRSRTCGKTGYNIFMRQMESSDVPRDERMGVVARLWKGLSDEQKSKYNKIAEKENAAAGIVKKVKKGESDKKAKSDSDSDSDKKDKKDKKAEKDKKANESEKKSEKKESEKDKKERIKELEKQRKKEVEELQKQKELLEKKKKELEQKKKDEALKKKAKYESSDDDFSENDSTSEDESEDEIENSDVEDSDAETASEDEDDE